jgi:inosine-uridine nucleoside N-ribohydrolase
MEAMAQPIIIISDPGIDGAFAVALAMQDPALEVVGLAATAGNVDAQQATKNVHILVAQIDPRRWPKLGAAPAVDYDVDGTSLHGPGGLGGVTFPVAELHHPLASDKLVVEMAKLYPGELTVVCLGPLTVLAQAMDRDPGLPRQVKRIICLGGAWHEPGNATAVAEFHFYCDPLSARQVLRAGAHLTLIPLDVMRKVLFSPSDLLELPNPESRTCRFLRQIIPFGIRASSSRYGIEGFHLKDVLGVAAAAMPDVITTRSMPVDVEIGGELTKGMSVVDARSYSDQKRNVDLATDVHVPRIREYIDRILRASR